MKKAQYTQYKNSNTETNCQIPLNMKDYNAPKYFVPVQNLTTIPHLKDTQLSNGMHRSFIACACLRRVPTAKVH